MNMTAQSTDLIAASLAEAGKVGLVWHFGSDTLEWHGNAAAILGLAPQDVPESGYAFKGMINPQDLPNLMTALQERATSIMSDETAEKVKFNEPFRIRRRDGTQQTVRMDGFLRSTQAGDGVCFGGLLSQTQEWNAAVSDDFLQGRQSVMDHLERILLGRSSALKGRGYFMALGLDRVGLLNEAYGATCVDSVLVDSEKRLSAYIQGRGTLGRLSGDIYVIIMPDLPHSQADALAAGLIQMFASTPIITMHGPVMLGVSMGGTALHADTDKASDLIARTETALQEAKIRGRGCFVSSMPLEVKRTHARKLLAGGRAVYEALEQNRMRLAFQPIVDNQTGNVAYYECLIRMLDQHNKIIPADQFIPALEELGMMRLLDTYSLHAATRELERYQDLHLSVNVSNLSLIDVAWLRSAVSLLANRPDIARRMIIEVTESSVMQHVEHAARVINTLKDLGCQVALDDFGAGQTSFQQLKMLNVDIVKIDKSYIQDISNPLNMLFVDALLRLAKGMGLETVAEGIETLDEAEMIKQAGIQHVQGYALGFPSIERVWLPKAHKERSQIKAAG